MLLERSERSVLRAKTEVQNKLPYFFCYTFSVMKQCSNSQLMYIYRNLACCSLSFMEPIFKLGLHFFKQATSNWVVDQKSASHASQKWVSYHKSSSNLQKIEVLSSQPQKIEKASSSVSKNREV